MEHGVVQNWDGNFLFYYSDMEKIWSHLYSHELKALPEQVNYPI